MASEESQEVLKILPRFNSHRELLNHLFNNKGIDSCLIRQIIQSNNIDMLTEVVCFILDRPDYPNHVKSLEEGSRCAEMASINYLGINHGYKPLDEQYSVLFHVLSLSKPAEMVDFFRILRSRTDWTSTEFRTAIKESPLHEYSRFVREELTQVTPARRHFFTLAFVTQLAFRNTPDSLNRWLHTELDDADITVIHPTISPQLHYQQVEHVYNEVFRNAIGGVNVDLFETLCGPTATKLRTAPKDCYKDLKVVEECDRLPLAARQAFLRYETFALSYLTIHANDYEIERLNKELQSDKTTDERKIEIKKLLKSFDILQVEYKKLFAYIIELFGVDLCTITEIIAVYLAAKIYGDQDTVELLKKVAGIDDSNVWVYDHSIRLRHMKDVSMCNGCDDTTKKLSQPELIRSLLEFFIRRNLIKASQWIIDQQPGKTLQDLSMETNFISLTASTAVAHPSTVKWLLKQKAKLCTNSKTASKNNIFVCALFSLGSSESRLEMVQEAFSFATRNTGFKPEVSVDEFFEGCRMSWSSAQWTEGAGMRLELLSFTLENIVNQQQWEKLKTTPEKYLKYIINSLANEIFFLSDFTSWTPEQLKFFHTETFNYIKLVLPESMAPYVAEESSFRRLLQFAFTTKNVPLLEYFLSFDVKVELNEIIGLTQTITSSFDYRDLITIPSPIFNTQDSTSETALAARTFQIAPYSLSRPEQLFAEVVDMDYCEHSLLLESNMTEQGLPAHVKEQIRGSAAKAGVKDIPWDCFPKNADDSSLGMAVVGGDGYETDGQIEPYVDEATSEEYLSTEEFQNGIEFLEQLFESNRELGDNQSPFISMLELLYNHCGTTNNADGTSDNAIEFGRYWLDPTNVSICIVTGNHLLWSILRQIYPTRAIDIELFTQLMVGASTTAFLNKRVWQDDYIFDLMIEMIGSTDHTQITALYDGFTNYVQQNASSLEYVTAREGVSTVSLHGIPDPTLPKLSPSTIWNIQQYLFTVKPIQHNQTTQNLMLSTVMAIALGYISVAGNAKMQSQRKYEQEAAAAEKHRKPIPPIPYYWVPANLFIDSLRLFALFFNQMKWFPQLLLKLFLLQFEIQNVSIYADCFDLFLSSGGVLLQDGIECRMQPAAYPILIPVEKVEKFYGYFEFVCQELHQYDMDKLQVDVESAMSKAQQAIDHHEAQNPQNALHSQAHHSPPKQSSASSYVLPVVIAVGAALAGLAGFFYLSNQSQDEEPVAQQSKAQRKK